MRPMIRALMLFTFDSSVFSVAVRIILSPIIPLRIVSVWILPKRICSSLSNISSAAVLVLLLLSIPYDRWGNCLVCLPWSADAYYRCNIHPYWRLLFCFYRKQRQIKWSDNDQIFFHSHLICFNETFTVYQVLCIGSNGFCFSRTA